ncbi:periplasmic heavy metal sensor [Pseudooceanicola nanhaiensis]|uniref:periplasmic heavy metal sensor n=1 Tax=Pseudooceanicola nanhaiensis TaxID=375761 RepID=UPI001CD4CE62|nr:periplasmic heavy metal sensor [Pseudooceanicola nanhaiensis]MCA0921091.1 periplasmic heavy metal sensor [Pseudooceanicola nanhaiensis]
MSLHHRGWRLTFWGVLVLSLFLNAVTLGVLWRFNTIRTTLNGDGGGLSMMSQDLRSGIIFAMRARRGEFTEAFERIGAARRAMFEAANARPYDREAVLAAMEEVRLATTEMQEMGQQLLLDNFDAAAGVAPPPASGS